MTSFVMVMREGGGFAIGAIRAGEGRIWRVGRMGNNILSASRWVWQNLSRAKLEFLWPGEFRARSPLPDGRVDFGVVLSGYTNSGFAIGKMLI
jgi:hypothetical protein